MFARLRHCYWCYCSVATFLHKGSGEGDENEELNNYASNGQTDGALAGTLYLKKKKILDAALVF